MVALHTSGFTMKSPVVSETNRSLVASAQKNCLSKEAEKGWWGE